MPMRAGSEPRVHIIRPVTLSFGNIMLIARQRAVTCCYTSLESMNMRSCALLEASDGA
jgi:hypothetical protein